MHQPVPDAVIDAFMALLHARSYETITLAEIAAGAGLSLGALREVADGRRAILAAFSRRIDRAVLDETETVSEDPPRDRLFDIGMRRFDKLSPYRHALASLAARARRDPALALCLNAMALPSARYMLEAAGLSTEGLHGLARVQGYVAMIGKVAPIWFDDTDPDQSRTMAAAWDHRLGKAERVLCRLACVGRRRRRRHARTTGEAAA